MGEPILTEEIRQLLVNRLREVEPWMQIDVVHKTVARCGKLLEDEMQKQQTAISAAKYRTSFLSLPAELRTRIYELVVIPQDEIETGYEDGLTNRQAPAIRLGYDYRQMNMGDDIGVVPQNKWAFQPAITRTCHRIRQEALPIFYGQNEFVTSGDDRLPWGPRVNKIRFPHALRWLHAIGPKNRKLLKAISIKGGSLNYRWISACRFLAVMAKEGIDDLPEGIVTSFYLESSMNQFGRPQTDWVEATPELEEQHSDFGDQPEVF